MNKSIRYLLNFLHKGHYKTIHFNEVAVKRFFEDMECPYKPSSLRDVAEYLGHDLYDGIYPVFSEYFFSTVFMDNGKPWNFIDAFMKKDYRLLNKEQREYIKLLRNSYMSIYEVLEVTPGESMLVKNLIEDEAPILVSEKSATQQIVKWTKLGMRLVHLEDGRTVAGGGLLSMPSEAADEVISLIQMMTNKMKNLSAQFKKQLEIPGEDSDLLQKKIWAKEIAIAWINHWLGVRSVGIRERMHNQDGDSMQFCKLQFPILVDEEEVANMIDDIKQMDWDKDYHWRWIEKAANSKMDIVFADVIIQNKKLIIQTNSMERAEEARDRLKEGLGDVLGIGLISMENMDKLIETHQSAEHSDAEKTVISSDEENRIIMEYKRDYYKKWLTMKIPAYDFSSLWEELGVAEEMRGQGSAK